MSTQTDGVARYGREFTALLSETWLGYAFMLPATLLLGVIVIYPTLRGVHMSFFELSLLQPSQETFVGLENFARMASDPQFWNAFWNSILLTGVAVALQYLVGLGMALALKEKLPGITLFRSATMVTWVLPVVVMVIIFRFLVQPEYGFINIVLGWAGLPTSYWFGNPATAFPLVVTMHVWRNAPFFAIALMAGMQSIPESLYEAAEMDGAGPLQQFRYVTLPQISHVSMIMIVLHVIYTFNNFDIVYLSTGGGPLGSTEVLATYVYKQAFVSHALGYAASIGVVMLVLLMLFTVVYVKLEDTE
ncbi:carbohydrate ABC transporter permease [Halogranum rubrum]|uniref:Binding-protein-dependent transport systems inner membrane component n=1 Tax=Halogranum salarium B-1 TaxID=1210908 RepID=J3ETY6_9EURY|nr:sugar ABC transporter permease [Halogranum salarium]EJN57697.1 binding-protein-dependent transport systems inner membrane component [Halogranum salarium B-1]